MATADQLSERSTAGLAASGSAERRELAGARAAIVACALAVALHLMGAWLLRDLLERAGPMRVPHVMLQSDGLRPQRLELLEPPGGSSGAPGAGQPAPPGIPPEIVAEPALPAPQLVPNLVASPDTAGMEALADSGAWRWAAGATAPAMGPAQGDGAGGLGTGSGTGSGRGGAAMGFIVFDRRPQLVHFEPPQPEAAGGARAPTGIVLVDVLVDREGR